ncbi:MAG: 50S ribosomal protein L35 [Planctomycetes bacterium]|nr:50S ribosomal protein L35 [Planctomycetota bacterium]
MPKMKTHKGLQKRVKLTAKGKVKRRMSFAGHLMSGKSGSRRRRLGQAAMLTGRIAKNIKTALGK